jgi:hypothetical protein
MGKADVTQAFYRQHARHGFPHEREHLARPGVEQQGLIIHDEVLVKGKPGAIFEYNRRIDAVNPGADFMHIRARLAIGNSHYRSPQMQLQATTRSARHLPVPDGWSLLGSVLLTCPA